MGFDHVACEAAEHGTDGCCRRHVVGVFCFDWFDSSVDRCGCSTKSSVDLVYTECMSIGAVMIEWSMNTTSVLCNQLYTKSTS